MNDRERDIGARLMEFRRGIGWSQSEFASLVGITRDQLASIEYGRTPLRYKIAWRIRDALGLSVDWLGGGDSLPNDLSEDVKLPLPEKTLLHENALLTEVFAKVYDLQPEVMGEYSKAGKKKGPRIERADIRKRAVMRLFVIGALDVRLPEVPKDYVTDFAEQTAAFMRQYIKQLPEEPQEIINARYDALLWEKMRAEIARRVIHPKSATDSDLTNITEYGNTKSVKAQWPLLKARLQKATSEKGGKSRLAEFLGVPLVSVSQWLTDSESAREPGAETALRMLYWVERRQ